MDDHALRQHIQKILKQDSRLWNKEPPSVLNQTLLFALITKTDAVLIGLLLKDSTCKKKFFIKVQAAYVFKANKFQFFLEENKLDNSYTIYQNRIGLTNGKHFLLDIQDIVLNFPYKDCVLEGGQSTEEGIDTYFEYDEKVTAAEAKKGNEPDTYNKKSAKRKEIFFNETLAQDEIDRLLDPKAFTKWKRYTESGETSLEILKDPAATPPPRRGNPRLAFNRNKAGTITENLIIKGNNLLTLYSLKQQFAGKIKLIYIDPPYNTGNDSFKYNDRFNHSTWLTFMKNRLEVSRELLTDDGVIFVQCDDNEQAYLKIMMDEIFGKAQTDCMVWRKSGVGRDGKMKNTTTFRKDHEYLILGFKELKRLNKSLEKPNWENSYPNPDNDPRGNYKAGSISKKEQASNPNHSNYFTVTSPSGRKFTRQFDVSKEKFEELDKDKRIYWGVNHDAVPAIKIFENEERETNTSSLILFNGTSTEGKKEIEELFGSVDKFPTPKPESIIKKIIQISTQPGDIILDYHLGSGTTVAVAHKMGRQYIGIEQMNYIEMFAVKRLKKVISTKDCDKGGISKAVNWQGGGSFIYCELAKWNQSAKEKILKANKLAELIAFFDEMYQRYFLNYNVKIKEFKEKIINESNFKALSLDEQKRLFTAMLDNNQLYVNKTEMADEKYQISEHDQDLTKAFYNDFD